jgi:hypothetical protein
MSWSSFTSGGFRPIPANASSQRPAVGFLIDDVIGWLLEKHVQSQEFASSSQLIGQHPGDFYNVMS